MPRADGVPRTTIPEIIDLLRQRQNVERRIEVIDRVVAARQNKSLTFTSRYIGLIGERDLIDLQLASVPTELLQTARVAIRLGMVHTSETQGAL